MAEQPLSTYPEQSDSRSTAVDSWLRWILHALLVVLIGAALLGVLGVKTTVKAAESGGFRLEVHHAVVTRPGLATPLSITVIGQEGLPEQIAIVIDSEYLAAFDENGFSPDPAETYLDGETEKWVFDVPPEATVFEITFDARLEPAVQSSRSATVRLVVDDVEQAAVPIVTRVMP